MQSSIIWGASSCTSTVRGLKGDNMRVGLSLVAPSLGIALHKETCMEEVRGICLVFSFLGSVLTLYNFTYTCDSQKCSPCGRCDSCTRLLPKFLRMAHKWLHTMPQSLQLQPSKALTEVLFYRQSFYPSFLYSCHFSWYGNWFFVNYPVVHASERAIC